jgi:hypothetical protein
LLKACKPASPIGPRSPRIQMQSVDTWPICGQERR